MSTETGTSAEAATPRWRWMDQRHQLLHEVLDRLPLMVAYVDREGVSRYRNLAMQGWLGRDPADRAELHVRDLLGSQQYAAVQKRLDAAAAGVPQVFERSALGETREAGSLESSYLPVVGPDGPDGFVVIIGDSSRRAAGESMRAHAIIRAALLEERTQLATLMHDDVLQALFSVGLELDLLTDLPPEAARRVESARATLGASIRGLRETIDLIAWGGGAASPLPGVERLVEATLEPSGIKAIVDHVGSFDDVPEHVTGHLLTVLAEALRNVIAHAGATEVSVTLVREQVGLCLVVADDGVGLDHTSPTDAAASRRRGKLAALGDQARRLEGSLITTDNLPRGTVVTWRVPLTQPT